MDWVDAVRNLGLPAFLAKVQTDLAFGVVRKRQVRVGLRGCVLSSCRWLDLVAAKALLYTLDFAGCWRPIASG